MKKILFAAAAIAAALFASCDKTDDTLDPAMPETSDTARIAITLTGADEADTRAFFDTSAKAEAWESSLSSLSVFAFDNSGALIIRRDFTSSELASKSATFALPKSAAGTECSFYAVANYDASSAKTRAALTALVEKSAADYNGTFAEVSSAAKRSGGFVMSGSTSKTIGAVNSTTSVGITLKRTVAKVALLSFFVLLFVFLFVVRRQVRRRAHDQLRNTLQGSLSVFGRSRHADARGHELHAYPNPRRGIG